MKPRTISSLQRQYDNLTPEDVYGEDEDETPPEIVCCSGAGEPCEDCVHGRDHERGDGCGPAVCERSGKEVFCKEVEV